MPGGRSIPLPERAQQPRRGCGDATRHTPRIARELGARVPAGRPGPGLVAYPRRSAWLVSGRRRAHTASRVRVRRPPREPSPCRSVDERFEEFSRQRQLDEGHRLQARRYRDSAAQRGTASRLHRLRLRWPTASRRGRPITAWRRTETRRRRATEALGGARRPEWRRRRERRLAWEQGNRAPANEERRLRRRSRLLRFLLFSLRRDLEERRGAVHHRALCHLHFLDIFTCRQVEHDLGEDLFENGAEPTSAG